MDYYWGMATQRKKVMIISHSSSYSDFAEELESFINQDDIHILSIHYSDQENEVSAMIIYTKKGEQNKGSENFDVDLQSTEQNKTET